MRGREPSSEGARRDIMRRRRDNKALALRFSVTTCSRCSAERLRARACDECGARPEAHEVQIDLQRRERLIRAFRDRRLAPESGNRLDPSTLNERFSHAHTQAVRALSSAAMGGEDPATMVNAFAVLDQLVADAQRLWPRPGTNRGRHLASSLGLFAEGMELRIDAIVAPTIHAVQDLDRRANAKIDEASRHLDRLTELDQAESELGEGQRRTRSTDSASRRGQPLGLARQLPRLTGPYERTLHGKASRSAWGSTREPST